MNKREEMITGCFNAGRDLTLWAPDGSAHDRVVCYNLTGARDYWLWRTRVAYLKGHTLTLCLGGYTTNTTLSRVNAFCKAYGLPVRVTRRDGGAEIHSLDGVPRHFGYWYRFACLRWKIEL